jgi:hypothetical protein
MSFILFIIATGLSLVLAERRLWRRDETTALANVKCLAKKPRGTPKEHF